VRCLLVNFCGAFARTDVMTEGVINAWKALAPAIPIIFTIHGTNEDEAVAMVKAGLGITPFDLMDDAVKADDDGLRPFYLPEHWVQAFTTTNGAPPSPLFGATFFTITGLHMFHVATGIIYLGVVTARVNKLKHEDVEISGLYWHFVDLVWMFVFPLIYILSVDMGHHLATVSH
jgi:hypothetical protein